MRGHFSGGARGEGWMEGGKSGAIGVMDGWREGGLERGRGP